MRGRESNDSDNTISNQYIYIYTSLRKKLRVKEMSLIDLSGLESMEIDGGTLSMLDALS